MFANEPAILIVLDDPAGLDRCAKTGLRPSIGLRRTYANSRRCAESDIVNGNDEFPRIPEGSMVILEGQGRYPRGLVQVGFQEIGWEKVKESSFFLFFDLFFSSVADIYIRHF